MNREIPKEELNKITVQTYWQLIEKMTEIVDKNKYNLEEQIALIGSCTSSIFITGLCHLISFMKTVNIPQDDINYIITGICDGSKKEILEKVYRKKEQ